jgi:hypothetical protein
MSKKRFVLPSNPGPLFDWVKRAQTLSAQSEYTPQGSLDIDSELRAAISADIKGCPLSRDQVAARMSDLTGQQITTDMLNSWTAESKDHHRFPCQFLPAFVIATGGRRAFECLSSRSGLFALPGPEALRAEIQRLDEEIRKKKGEKNKRMLFLREIEGVRK